MRSMEAQYDPKFVPEDFGGINFDRTATNLGALYQGKKERGEASFATA